MPQPACQPWRTHGSGRTAPAFRRRHCSVTASAALLPRFSLLPATSPWGIWAGLALAAAGGFWSERTRVGKELSGATWRALFAMLGFCDAGPLVTTLLGLALSNCGVIPSDAPAVYGVVNRYLLPLAVPLLLFSADLRRVLTSTGRLLVIFAVGSVGTVVGTLVAARVMPLQTLGSDAWKIAAALAARHIGGAVNYVAVAEATAMTPSAQAAGLAADNLICAVYFTTIYWLARRIGADSAKAEGSDDGESQGQIGIQVLEAATAIAISAVICYVGSSYAAAVGSPGLTIPIVTAITVALATLMPQPLQPLIPSAEGIAALLMNIFFATVGAAGSISAVIRTAPSLFVFSLVQIGLHLGIILGAGRLMGFSRRDVLLASNANVGGPTTAAGMCVAKGWRTSMVPSLLIGTAGYAVATFLCIPLGELVLRRMM